ncbi:hypothetical protein FOWG_02515 [Fusarium oxysporum f. sp. lycopersici MN25]|nr:hypothetical protein FOWG_02515 [Fusarium oxysporum f. sp. lycopersici MN25]EWZ98386.1 hypothetical protein FOWG_02515 [Fusarium oxysporum f. sp. lycopersici MN25]EWZ98387.1 hypothetical protein FOWG_02515 [Fusarium oxysporum f. sp. lycopersici MN25]EWZ98388.1 hypothetical protein FOWG_02515 [Fusarium oxysporum f. sp. lycopersici MN25]
MFYLLATPSRSPCLCSYFVRDTLQILLEARFENGSALTGFWLPWQLCTSITKLYLSSMAVNLLTKSLATRPCRNRGVTAYLILIFKSPLFYVVELLSLQICQLRHYSYRPAVHTTTTHEGICFASKYYPSCIQRSCYMSPPPLIRHYQPCCDHLQRHSGTT